MNKLFPALSFLILAAFALLLTGCDTIGLPLMSSEAGNTAAPRKSPSQIIQDITPSPDFGDDLMSDLNSVGEGIRDFAEGTIVDIASVPDVVKAVTDRYEDVTVTGITHAMHLDKQVYKVTYTDKDGATNTVYVSPDGSSVTEAVEPEGTGADGSNPSPTDSPDSGASPKADESPDSSASPSASPTPAEEG